MRIIIVGAGKVGLTVAKTLAEEEHEVTIIDKKPDAFDKIQETMDVMTMKGNGLLAGVLLDADAGRADLIIGLTNTDEANILCCLTAKKLGVKHTIARVRDPEYALDLMEAHENFGLDMIVNPEQQAAVEISRLLYFPSAMNIETFMGGRTEMVSVKITDDCSLGGKNVAKAFPANKFQVVLTTVERGDDILIPKGDTRLAVGDIVRVLGKHGAIMEFFHHAGIPLPRIKSAMIIGGGKICRYLARELLKLNMDVKIIEKDRPTCEKLIEELPYALVIEGDGTDEGLLESEDLAGMDAVVCLTDRDEENVIMALNAANRGVGKVVTKINHINREMVKRLVAGSVICPKNTTADLILRYARGLNPVAESAIQTLYRLIDTEETTVEALEFSILKNTGITGRELKTLRLKPDILIGCISRGGAVTAARGSSVINEGDTVVVVAKNRVVENIGDILAEEDE